MDADLRLAGRSESTRTTYLDCAKRFVKHFMRPPQEMGEKEVREFVLYLTEERRLSVGTRLAYLGAVKFLYGVTLGRPEVTAGIPWPKARRRNPVVPTRDEISRLLRATRDRYWWTFFLTAYGAGLRRMEIAALRAENIDSRSGLIHVETAKGDKPRSVMLDPLLLAVFREHWREHRLPGPFLFPARRAHGWHDHPITQGTASRAFRRAADRARLERHLTLHGLRHAFATHLLEEGVGLTTLRVLLGHSEIETTSQYTEVRTDHIRATPSLLCKLRM
jgi:integrase